MHFLFYFLDQTKHANSYIVSLTSLVKQKKTKTTTQKVAWKNYPSDC